MAEKQYIEREAIVKASCERCNGVYVPCDKEHCLLMEVIHSIPAADVRPVVRGHWTNHRTIEHDGEWYCSACGKEITIYMGPDREDRYTYCPNCGADMKEES